MTRPPPHLTLVPLRAAADARTSFPEAAQKSTAVLPRTALPHLDALHRFARNLTGRDDDAEDLVQETYARAISGWAQFIPGTNLRAWLFRILRNAFVDSYRGSRINPVRVPLDEGSTASATSAREPLRSDVELERLRGVATADIEAALATLSVDARAIVLLDLEGFTESELAHALGCAVGTVKSRLARARAILRDRLRDDGR